MIHFRINHQRFIFAFTQMGISKNILLNTSSLVLHGNREDQSEFLDIPVNASFKIELILNLQSTGYHGTHI